MLKSLLLVCLLTSALRQGLAQDPAIQTLKTSTRLVVVDVTVTDRKGHAVHNLKASDFQLLEDNHTQTLRHADEHTPEVKGEAGPPFPKLPPGTFTNLPATPGNGALNILLLDSLNTPLEDQAFVHGEIVKYLKAPNQNVRMAIFGLGAQLHLLQGFTSDPEVLRAAVNGKRAGPKASILLGNQLSDRPDAGDISDQNLLASMDNAPTDDFVQATYAQFEQERANFALSLKVRVTLEALDAMARYLSAIPGRKNLIWFSGAFPINVLPNGDLKYPFAAALDLAGEFRTTSDLLAQAQVSVYPIDARGLSGSAIDVNSTNYGTQNSLAAGLGGNGQQETILSQRAGAQSTMLTMAENTGGKAFINTNDLREAVRASVDAGSNFYTLAYTPSNRDWKGDYRKLEVKLAQSGYTLSYRRGYYADDPDTAAPAHKAGEAPRPILAYNPMRVAMLFGGPDPSQIVFSATLRPASGTPEPDLAPGNKLEAKANGPYVRYNVILKADAKAITAPATDKGRHIDLGFLTYVYDSRGKLINTTGSHVISDIPADRFDSMLGIGIAYQQQISVPVQGEYFLRIGVSDQISGKVGALEVPVARVASLKAAPTRGN